MTADKIDLGDGAWAKLRDPKKVSERNRRPLRKVRNILIGSRFGDILLQWENEHPGQKPTEEEMAQLIRPMLASDEMDLFDSSAELGMFALTEEWSYDQEITVEAIKDLPGDAYDALQAACDPLVPVVLGDQKDDDIDDPNSNFPARSD